ncbi:MAG: DUF1489 family protein [Alphaproteobacteria bacterium]
MKLAVGADDVDDIARFQRRRLEETGTLGHFTRHMPTRGDELLDGGSMFWVVRGVMRVRQRLLGFERLPDEEGRTRCRILLDPELVRTEPRAFAAFQGWRYLQPKDAPPDLGGFGPMEGDSLPAALIEELRTLGLW